MRKSDIIWGTLGILAIPFLVLYVILKTSETGHLPGSVGLFAVVICVRGLFALGRHILGRS